MRMSKLADKEIRLSDLQYLYANLDDIFTFSDIMAGMYGIYRRFFDFYYSYDVFYSHYWPYLYQNLNSSFNVGAYVTNSVNGFVRRYEKYVESNEDMDVELHTFELTVVYFLSYMVLCGIIDVDDSILDFCSIFTQMTENDKVLCGEISDIAYSFRVFMLKKREYNFVHLNNSDIASIFSFLHILSQLGDDRKYSLYSGKSKTFRRIS